MTTNEHHYFPSMTRAGKELGIYSVRIQSVCEKICQSTRSNYVVCITVENSPNASSVYIRLCKNRKKVFYCFYTITFTRKKRKTLCMALIKREILTRRKILSTKSCTRNQFLFCKKMFSKIRTFLA